MTLIETYYAMNTAINKFFQGQNMPKVRVHKYGTVVEEKKVYPYFQSAYRFKRGQPFGTTESGTLTDFEYILNFFTAAPIERENDAALYKEFDMVREAITNPYYFIWRDIANIMAWEPVPEFAFKSGVEVLQLGLKFDMQKVTSHVLANNAVDSTIDNSVEVATKKLEFKG
jgi:hypothetical protein